MQALEAEAIIWFIDKAGLRAKDLLPCTSTDTTGSDEVAELLSASELEVVFFISEGAQMPAKYSLYLS